MIRALIIALALVTCALMWQNYQLDTARRTLDTQRVELANRSQALTQSNNQLQALAMLSAAHARAQTTLYAQAEQTRALLGARQRKIRELTRENQTLRQWADTALPADIIRLRQRPAITGSAAYRRWLSTGHNLPAGTSKPAQ